MVYELSKFLCEGCGLENIAIAYLDALKSSNIKNFVTVLGIGCTSAISGAIDGDRFCPTHGRAIPFAEGLKLGNPKLNINVITCDNDLFTVGAHHFVHACRRNIGISVIGVNNYYHGMMGNQSSPTTILEPFDKLYEKSNTKKLYLEPAFNLPYLAMVSGAGYVARWTVFHKEKLTQSIAETLNKKGFKFIEVLSTCPLVYGQENDIAKYFREHTVIKNDAKPKEIEIEKGKDIIIGKFRDVEKSSYEEELEKLSNRVRKK
ncbi:MAG: thiamine pyrophosphate-dependent enzyme [Candidatus Thermoplasmatota archaeon]